MIKNDPYGDSLKEQRRSIKENVPLHWLAPKLDSCYNCRHNTHEKTCSPLIYHCTANDMGADENPTSDYNGTIIEPLGYYRCPKFNFPNI